MICWVLTLLSMFLERALIPYDTVVMLITNSGN